MKRCLILVPHPDDEINTAGCVFDCLINNHYEVFVAFMTYGDYYSKFARIRTREAIKAQQYLQYQHIVFLGYGDGYKGTHIYNASDNSVCISHSGYSSTYNVGDIQSYHFQKYGRQASYTRSNLKADIRNLVLDIYPDLIICTDTDNHPEHRALSLLFDEVIGEIIKKSSYRPIVWKRFAYIGAYKGNSDFFTNPINETTPSFFKQIDETLSFPYSWAQRRSLPVSKNNATFFFWRSPVFKALRCHSSQHAVIKFSRIVNKDFVYWERDSNSFTYNADVIVSSGDKSYINDFKIVDTDNIESTNPTIIPSFDKSWHPTIDDKEPYIKFLFQNGVEVSCVRIYRHPNSKIKTVRVSFNNGYVIDWDKCDDSTILIAFPKQKGVKELILMFRDFKDISISEVEILQESIMPQDSTLICNDTSNKDGIHTVCLWLCRFLFMCIVVFHTTIIWGKRIFNYIKRKI